VTTNRGAGESWAAIGERLGISRQAAQKRYATPAGEAAPRLPSVYAKMVNDGKRAVVHAQEEARRRQGGYIGTEHLLLGVAAEPECVGAQSLASCGAAAQVVVAAINGRIGVPAGEPRTDQIPFTPKGKAVLEHALRESARLGHDYVGTGHLALGCLTVKDGLAAEILTNLGVTYDDLRQAVVMLAPADPPLAR
jgi:ATP-dependent Clp protease ATP-binding subunit ClpA